MAPLRITVVSYLNSVPFVYGIRRVGNTLPCELTLASPSECARVMDCGQTDIALVTVAEIPKLRVPVKVICDYCLGTSDGARTVTLLSNSELNEIETIILDPESCTSNTLTEILCREYWGINPKFEMREGHSSIDSNSEKVGFVLIGDRVFDFESRFKQCWDLSVEWKKMTGLPFVFAAWVAKTDVDEKSIEALNSALALGVENIEQAVAQSDYHDKNQALNYLTKNIDFIFNRDKHTALALFWEKGVKCSERVNPG
ncbi:MAG: menaquinone biosynthesis protein [Muribaculaceae bacterium]|nr:menaquinone biosynthesis protein [Muribaculaceae bacterium]